MSTSRTTAASKLAQNIQQAKQNNSAKGSKTESTPARREKPVEKLIRLPSRRVWPD